MGWGYGNRRFKKSLLGQLWLAGLLMNATCLIFNAHATLALEQTNRLQSRPFYQEIRQTLDALTRAEIVREEATLAGQQGPALDAVRKQCRQAIFKLRTLEASLSELLRKSYLKRPSQRNENDWTTDELESLGRNIKVQLARAYRNQALCYAAASPDRVNALSLALNPLNKVINQPAVDTGIWRARVEQLVCLRLLQQNGKARQQLDRWQKSSPPKKIATRFFGEEILLHLSEGAVQQAWATAKKVQGERVERDDESTVPAGVPETEDAILTVLLAMREQSSPALMPEFTRRVMKQLQHIATAHGPYWQRRAEVRLGRSLATKLDTELVDTGDTALLGYAAASLYSTGQLRDAVKTFDRIAALQTGPDDANRKFQAQKTAAAIVRKMNLTAETLTRFRHLALQNPKQAEASSMHLIAIGQAAQLARSVTTEKRGEAFERYHALLKEHLQHWPQQPSAKKVRQWLAKSRQPEIERQRAQTLADLGDRQQAITLTRKLLTSSPNDAKLAESLATLLAAGTAAKELREALALWRSLERRSKPGGPRWWRGRRARLQLLSRLGEGEKTKQLRQLTEILYPLSAGSQ